MYLCRLNSGILLRNIKMCILNCFFLPFKNDLLNTGLMSPGNWPKASGGNYLIQIEFLVKLLPLTANIFNNFYLKDNMIFHFQIEKEIK